MTATADTKPVQAKNILAALVACATLVAASCSYKNHLAAESKMRIVQIKAAQQSELLRALETCKATDQGAQR